MDSKNQIIDRITKEWADRGLVMEGGWRAFLAVGMPKDTPLLQVAEMRKAYYLGAQHLFASVMSMLDPGMEPTEKDLDRMSAIHKELEDYVKGLKR